MDATNCRSICRKKKGLPDIRLAHRVLTSSHGLALVRTIVCPWLQIGLVLLSQSLPAQISESQAEPNLSTRLSMALPTSVLPFANTWGRNYVHLSISKFFKRIRDLDSEGVNANWIADCFRRYAGNPNKQPWARLPVDHLVDWQDISCPCALVVGLFRLVARYNLEINFFKTALGFVRGHGTTWNHAEFSNWWH